MKKNKNKKFSINLKTSFFTILIGFLLLINSAQSMGATNVIAPFLTEEVVTILDREKQLINARLKLKWEEIHSFQHPDFRKKVSVDEIRYFEGWVASDYREKAKQNAHISGSFVPTLDFIKRNPNKRDPLGFPVQRRYKWSEDPFLKINGYDYDKVFISTDGKYAKVRLMVKGKQRINPVIARGNFAFDAKYLLTDYWEKVDGEWVITLLTAPINSSGTGVLKYYLPNDKSGWEKAQFVEINP
jgi:hypothetical protein